jgi:hypothetical protein
VGRLHPRHRTGANLALLDQPGKEALKAAVAVRGGRRSPAGELVGNESLDVLAADDRDIGRHAALGEEAAQGADRLDAPVQARPVAEISNAAV